MNPHRSFGESGRREAIAFWSLRTAVVLVVATVLLYGVALAPGAPYHIRELFGASPSLPQAFLFAVLVLLALAPPALLGLQLVRDPSPWAWLYPIGILLHAVLVFLLFRFATPIASVHDLVGLPVWGMAPELERLVRFIGVFMAVSVPVSGGTALLYAITRSFEPQRFLWWLLFAVLFLAFGYWVVVGMAATENVTELLRTDAYPLAWIGLSFWMLLLAFAASMIAERLSGVFTGTLAVSFGVILLLPLSFGVLFLALEPRVLGPESNLSALGFLLSVTRTAYLESSGLALFGRYALAYGAVLLLLVFAVYPVWIGYATRRFARRAIDSATDSAVG